MSHSGDGGMDADSPADGPSRNGPESREFEDLRLRVTSAVRHHCPHWLATQAEDIVQNVLLKLLKSSRKSAGKKTFSSVYLEKSACGAVVDEIRRACRRREAPVQDPEEIDRIIREGIPDPVGTFYRFSLAASQLRRSAIGEQPAEMA